MKSLEKAEFFTQAFLSFGQSASVQAESFFLSCSEKNELTRLTNESLPLAKQVMVLIAIIFSNYAYKPTKNHMDIYIQTIMNYIDAHHQLPQFLFSSTESQNMMAKLDQDSADKLYSCLKKNMLQNKLLRRLIRQFARQRNSQFAKLFLTQKCYEFFWEDIDAYEPNEKLKIFSSLMAVSKYEIDFLILSRSSFHNCVDLLQSTPVGGLLFGQMLERIKYAFDSTNIVNGLDISEQRGFNFGGDLSRDTQYKISCYEKYACLSYSEIAKIYEFEKANKRTQLKDECLKHHHLNMQMLVNSFKSQIHSHISIISVIYYAYKDLATNRFIRMTHDACNPEHYLLDKLPKEMQCVVVMLKYDERLLYNQRLKIMGEIFEKLQQCNTINFEDQILLGFMPMKLLISELLKRFPDCTKEVYDKGKTARSLSRLIINLFEESPRNNLKDCVYTLQTIENVTKPDGGEFLYLKAFSLAPNLLNGITTILKKKIESSNSPMLTLNDFLSAAKEYLNAPPSGDNHIELSNEINQGNLNIFSLL